MSSNFAFLQAEWPDLAAEAQRSEQSTIADPRTSCFYARRTLELALDWLFQADASLQRPYKSDLSALLFEPTLRILVGHGLQTKMDLIRRQGNAAVHRPKSVAPADALAVVRELFHVLYWIARTYSRTPGDLPEAGAAFDASLIPRPVPASVRLKSQQDLAQLAEELATKDAALEAERQKTVDYEAEIARLRAEIATVKTANEARPDDHDYDEAATRDLFIDLLLKEAGWALDQARDREFEVSGMPNNRGIGYVDYVLWGDDGLPLAVVEAKRTRRNATVGQQQAKLYADCLDTAYGKRPVIFYTNGYEHWLWDDLTYPPRQVQGFYTKDELQLLIQRRRTRLSLADVEVNDQIVERHYQVRAIRRISERFEIEKQREALLVMATGAGKTRTVIALVDVLMRANWVKRVLFLADRVALVNQARNAFKEHLPDSSPVNLVTERNADGRVYVSTYPTMMGLIDQGAGDSRRFGPGYFDLVIIDEAHRSVYQKYRAIFEWFDSMLVGLTATPKDEVDRNTYRLFNLEDGVPTDAYPLDEAVKEHYLVPPRAASVPLKFQREGIRYDDLSEDEKDSWDAQDWGEEGEIPDVVEADAVNRWLFNADTVEKVLQTLIAHGRGVAGGDRLGKTIVFAKNNAHAEFIAQRFDANYPEFAGHFARVITYQTEYAQSLIDDFSTKDKPPHIVISVDMLDTGIDIPEVVNLVFFKIVRAKSKFWQMIGRGTRLCPDLYAPGEDKEDFLVFDFCQNLEYFNQNLRSAEGTLVESLAQRLFRARLDLVTTLDQRLPDGDGHVGGTGVESEAGLRRETAEDLHRRVKGMNLDNFFVRPQRRWIEIYADASNWHVLTPEKVGDIAEHLSGLPTTEQDDDQEAKRFDLVMLRLQLGYLNAEPGVERLRRQVQEIASALLEQTRIPAIRAQQRLLDDVAGDEWWQDVTLPMLELLRLRVRALVKLIEKSRRVVVYTDFADQLGEPGPIEIQGLTIGNTFERFRAKARVYLRAHEDHVALQRLRLNKQLSATDLDELERMLVESGVGSAVDIARARKESQGLGLFIRSLVGLDRAAAVEAFAQFLSGKAYSASQIDFVNVIVHHLTEGGVMEPERLYESPFTDLAPQGPDGLFGSPDVEGLIAILHSVRATASPEVSVA